MLLFPYIAGCGLPPNPTNGYVDDFESSEEGAELVYECNPGLLPTGRNTSTCIAGVWAPDPAALLCSCPGQFARQLASILKHICIRSHIIRKKTRGMVKLGLLRICAHDLLNSAKMKFGIQTLLAYAPWKLGLGVKL